MTKQIDVNEHIRREIVARRKKMNCNQDVLAQYLGLQRVSIVNIEKGRQKVTPSTLYLLACAFNCQVSDLFPSINHVTVINETVEKVVLIRKVVKQQKISKLNGVTAK